ncbi:MAG: histidinol-phosphate transaminase [Deltaproteobacteria bacterium]|nr:histidinol-phosphate transaminase [Deltaproteobacteria bacterium]
MGERGPTRAIILAAGTGSRLVAQDAYPKPLKPVAGVPLLVRVLRNLQTEGIREAVIVIGYRGDQIKRALLAEPSLGLRLHFVSNDEYERKNGVSLLKAASFVQGDCLLSMADHLYSPELVRRLRQFDLVNGNCVLGVDRDIERCFDIDDATKVRLSGSEIKDIGKDLSEYDAIDTGVFRIGPALIQELERVRAATGDCSLSDGVRALAERGEFLACDVGDARWIDVDTPEAHQRAEAMVRVFGDELGDEPGASHAPIDPEGLELFAPTWVRGLQPYNEDHFEVAGARQGVARMMSNESPFAPSERVVRAILEAAQQGNNYPAGASTLRRKLGAREGFDETNVTLGNGSTELIDIIIRTFVSPGEEVLLSVPTFSMYENRTRAIGGVPILVPMTEDNDFDIAKIVSAVTERTKVIFLCTPNNPTGNRIDEVSVRRILGLGLPTVIDEAYVEFSDGETLSHLIREFPNAIILRTFSKAYGLAGLRVGYVMSHPVVSRLFARLKLPWNVNGVTVAAAIAVLEDQEEFESRMTRLRQGRAYLVRELSRMPGLEVVPSEGNFVLVDTSATGVRADAVVAGMLTEGVLIRSLAVHHAARSFVRVTVGDESQNARCVEAMRRVVSRLSRPTQPIPELTLRSNFDAE